MRTLLLLLLASASALAQAPGRRTIVIEEYPAPAPPRYIVREYRSVPMAPVVVQAPAYLLPAVPVYAAPRVPVAVERYGLFGQRSSVYYSDGSVRNYGPFGGRR